MFLNGERKKLLFILTGGIIAVVETDEGMWIAPIFSRSTDL